MRLRLGVELDYQLAADTPMITMVNVHPSVASRLEYPDLITTTPAVPIHGYYDGYGNWCCRLLAPAGRFEIRTSTVIRDNGLPDPYHPEAIQHRVEDLPYDTLVYLLGSRYCETDRLADEGWRLFGHTQPGWGRVQAVCDFVHNHIRFGYENARNTRTAAEAYAEGVGVCRDFAHLAVAFCRTLNIPTRYCTGYISDVGEPPPYAAMDLAAWIEVYLSGQWHVFDPRNNKRRYGRIPIAYGRDAADVPITHTFGPNILSRFAVITEEA
ncbi:transglutaminase [Kaistia algarum]|uniref:transglutaminase-like domain-containing protein n=1 Tax=Kaistia algarum TaxID=2083279 RepID=UPI000CE778AC|nr:transglutaminase family protein [Kaistia algarum]MCX5512488.1 transglutaminase family protein [Kaistia algarum]PPE77111.1 transglutaminase [Kaistia algarum]